MYLQKEPKQKNFSKSLQEILFFDKRWPLGTTHTFGLLCYQISIIYTSGFWPWTGALRAPVSLTRKTVRCAPTPRSFAALLVLNN
jgi:hypothetical protein